MTTCPWEQLTAQDKNAAVIWYLSLTTWLTSTKEKSKQNITRDIEVKNNLTIARAGGGGGDSGKRGLQKLL